MPASGLGSVGAGMEEILSSSASICREISSAPFALFLIRTPGSPPFSAMNSTPAFSSAATIFSPVSGRPPSSPPVASSRFIVGIETPDASPIASCYDTGASETRRVAARPDLCRLVRGTSRASASADGRRGPGPNRLRGLGRRGDAGTGALHGGRHSPADGSNDPHHSERALGGRSGERRRSGSGLRRIVGSRQNRSSSRCWASFSLAFKHTRDVHYWTPPAQIRTSGFPAYGSHLGCLTAKRSLGQG